MKKPLMFAPYEKLFLLDLSVFTQQQRSAL